MRKIIALLSVLFLAVVLGIGSFASTASATQGTEHKVTICHRTKSITNPYVQITVDVASVDGDSGNDHGKGDHLAEHTGPVFDPAVDTHSGDVWGDIIPPLYADGTPDGMPSLNWDEAGQAIFNNGCNVPTPTETCETAPSPELCPQPPAETRDVTTVSKPDCTTGLVTTTVTHFETPYVWDDAPEQWVLGTEVQTGQDVSTSPVAVGDCPKPPHHTHHPHSTPPPHHTPPQSVVHTPKHNSPTKVATQNVPTVVDAGLAGDDSNDVNADHLGLVAFGALATLILLGAGTAVVAVVRRRGTEK